MKISTLAFKTLPILLFLFTACLNGFSQTDFWTQISDLGYDAANMVTPKARSGAVGFSINGKGYIGTGSIFSGTELKDFWEYDPDADTWAQKADFGGQVREYAVGFSIGDKGYLGTGNTFGASLDFWEYDPVTNSWTQRADLPAEGRIGAVGFSIWSKGYIGTGNTELGSHLKDFLEYDPDA